MINQQLRGLPGFHGCYHYQRLAQVLWQGLQGWFIVYVEEHWVGLFVQDKTIIVLETLGREKGHLDLLCDELPDYWVYANRHQLQSDWSEACGFYCILFVQCRISSLCDFDQFLSWFSTHQLALNDVLLYNLL